jgi:hypothetical protein
MVNGPEWNPAGIELPLASLNWTRRGPLPLSSSSSFGFSDADAVGASSLKVGAAVNGNSPTIANSNANSVTVVTKALSDLRAVFLVMLFTSKIIFLF